MPCLLLSTRVYFVQCKSLSVKERRLEPRAPLDSGEAWEYEYNRRNKVIRGVRKNGTTPLDGYDFGYGGTGYRRSVFVLDLSGAERGAGGVHGLVASARPGAPAGARRELPVVDGNEWGRKAGKCRPGTRTGRLGRRSRGGAWERSRTGFQPSATTRKRACCTTGTTPPNWPLAEQSPHRGTGRGKSVWDVRE